MEVNDKETISVLFIDDNEDEYIIIRRLLMEIGNHYNVHYINNFHEGLDEIVKATYNICLLDYRLGIRNGIDFIQEAIARVTEIPIILLTGQGDHNVDVAAMQAGASDYLDKGRLDSNILERSIRYAIERKKSEEKIKYLAYYDQLTDLPNRTLFMDRLKVVISTAVRYKRIFAVMFIDIDNFKIINDTLGHSVGDELIKEVAVRLLKSIRKGDTLGRCDVHPSLDTVARMGGDEFIILLSEINELENASKVAERIQNSLHSPIVLDNNSIIVTISIGIAVYPSDGGDIETIIKHADIAMYNAKSLGKNNFQYFIPSMNNIAQKRLILENDLNKAIRNNEFCVYYQPIINIKTKKIDSLEALVRWQHPAKGMISPMDFIPIAEENGMILNIGEHVLRIIGKQNQKWKKMGIPDIAISVNVSPKQLNHMNFIKMLKNMLKQFHILPEMLTIEITENSIVNNIMVVNEIISEIRELGIQLSLDDFGSGYSSFVTLKQIPFNIIKIDRSFISNIPDDPGDSTITSSIISIGHSMNLKVVAEGIEKQSQLSFLESHSCDLAQGYYFYRPMPAEQIEKFISSK